MTSSRATTDAGSNARPLPHREQPRATAHRRSRRGPRAQLARIEPPAPGHLVTSAGGAAVTAARVGRLFGRTGMRLARQLPGVREVETVVGAQVRMLGVAAAGFGRALSDVGTVGIGFTHTTIEEQRAVMLVESAPTDPQPLRTAMTELLDRSVQSDDGQNRDYLFGTIVSQLVPDEARIVAALSTGRRYAAVDVVSKRGERTTMTNASTVGAAAGVAVPANTGTYLTRLQQLGLVEFGNDVDGLNAQFESLRSDPAVRAARAAADDGKQGSSKSVRKSVALSPLGQEFWSACSPAVARS